MATPFDKNNSHVIGHLTPALAYAPPAARIKSGSPVRRSSPVQRAQNTVTRWMAAHQAAVGFDRYAQPEHARQALLSMPNSVARVLGGPALLASHQALVHNHLRATEQPVLSFDGANGSFAAVLAQLPYAIAQKIITERGQAMMRVLEEWGENIRKNAKLDKKAAMRAQRHHDQENQVQRSRRAVLRSERDNARTASMLASGWNLATAAVPSPSWEKRGLDRLDGDQADPMLFTAKTAGAKGQAPAPAIPFALSGVQLRRLFSMR